MAKVTSLAAAKFASIFQENVFMIQEYLSIYWEFFSFIPKEERIFKNNRKQIKTQLKNVN